MKLHKRFYRVQPEQRVAREIRVVVNVVCVDVMLHDVLMYPVNTRTTDIVLRNTEKLIHPAVF